MRDCRKNVPVVVDLARNKTITRYFNIYSGEHVSEGYTSPEVAEVMASTRGGAAMVAVAIPITFTY